jgi:hypothetical protein
MNLCILIKKYTKEHKSKLTKLKGEINNTTIIFGYLNTNM